MEEITPKAYECHVGTAVRYVVLLVCLVLVLLS